MLKVFLVGIGGFFGSASRYALGIWVTRISNNHHFPFGTLTVNILGCFLIGFFAGAFDTKISASEELKLILLVGFLGGFTTFSTFSHETLRLFQNDQMISGFLNIAVSIAFCIIGVWLGHFLSKG